MGLPRRGAAMAPHHLGLQHPRRGAACVPTTWTSTSEGNSRIFRPSHRSVRILTELRHVVHSLFLHSSSEMEGRLHCRYIASLTEIIEAGVFACNFGGELASMRRTTDGS